MDKLKKQFSGIIKKIGIIFSIFFVIGCFLTNVFINFITSLIPIGVELVAFAPSEVLISIITIILMFAVTCTFPFVLLELTRFVLPALFEKEKRYLKKFLPITITLFSLGVVFGVIVVAFFGLSFFAEFNTSFGVTSIWSLNTVIGILLMAGIGFGVAFQFPILMFVCNKVGLVSVERLKFLRKYVIVLLLVVTGLLTPPDVVSQLIMFVPLYLLFESTLFYLGFSKKKRSKH
jgi:sec-independent protein translocase protein TatC